MIFIDFEASAPTGYPIETGICRVNADRSLTSGGKLIRRDEWLDEYQRWDSRAEQDSRHLASWYAVSLKDNAAVHRLLPAHGNAFLRVPFGNQLLPVQRK